MLMMILNFLFNKLNRWFWNWCKTAGHILLLELSRPPFAWSHYLADSARTRKKRTRFSGKSLVFPVFSLPPHPFPLPFRFARRSRSPLLSHLVRKKRMASNLKCVMFNREERFSLKSMYVCIRVRVDLFFGSRLKYVLDYCRLFVFRNSNFIHFCQATE